MKITLLCRGRGKGAARPSSPPTTTTPYFIPRLHNRLFVSRFYPRVRIPTSTRLPFCQHRVVRAGRSEGIVKKCPEDIVNLLSRPSPFPLPRQASILSLSRARFASEHLLVVRALPPKTARPKSTGNKLRWRTYPRLLLLEVNL